MFYLKYVIKMNIFKKYFNQSDNQINPDFEKMPQEQLINLAYSLKEKNNKQKEEIDKLTEENNNLKDSILNRKKNTSEIKNIYKDLKNTLFSSDEIDINEKNKEFNDFLYDQYLLYGGLEEEEINDLNQIKIKEDNWSDNKDLFIFKQKIIERNYQELFRNIAASNELKKLYGLNNVVNDNNSNIVKDSSNISEDNKKEKLNLNSDKNVAVTGEGKKKKVKSKKDKDKDKLKDKKSSSDLKSKINIDSIDPIKNMKKKEETNNLLDDLLKEDNIEEDNEISFKDISKNN